jgi:hypothetical protein
MRIAYATTDEVNRALATQLAAEYGAAVCQLRPGAVPPKGLFDAILHDLDAVPEDDRLALIEAFCHDPPNCPTAVHGYHITDEEVKVLRRCGIGVAQRLRNSLFRRLCKAVQQKLATVPPDDDRIELTWVNLVD